MSESVYRNLTDKMSVKTSADGVSHEIVAEFDFAGVTSAQLDEILLAGLRVKYQARLRKLGDKALAELAKKEKVEAKVAEIMTRTAGTVDPLKVADRISDEQAEELLKKLMERLGKK